MEQAEKHVQPTPMPLTVALDIGTTKICAIAGRLDEFGKLEILGVGKVASTGVNRGVVSNIEKTVSAIKEAIESAERAAGTSFAAVHVGIAGQHIKSRQHRGILTRDNNHDEINQADIAKLITDMHKLVLPPGDKILHVIPQEFTVDSEQGITDPIGMSGVRLEANFHIITGQTSASSNIFRCVERAGLKAIDLTLEPIASAHAVLSDEEKEAGVALVDIGGGTTDLSIFKDGIIRHTAVIPFGGNAITDDIAEGCHVTKKNAEKLKVKFGSALADEIFENRIISINGINDRGHKEIAERNLALIIQARVEEIFDFVLWEIKRSGYERGLIAGIVITGGGALLKHLDKLVEYHTSFNCRVGVPRERLAHGYTEGLVNPIYATSVGLLLHGIENGSMNHVEDQNNAQSKDAKKNEPNKGSFFDKVFRKTKEWFEVEPDIHI